MNKKYISFSKPDLGKNEIKSVNDVIRSGWLTTGKKTQLFEKGSKFTRKQNLLLP